MTPDPVTKSESLVEKKGDTNTKAIETRIANEDTKSERKRHHKSERKQKEREKKAKKLVEQSEEPAVDEE